MLLLVLAVVIDSLVHVLLAVGVKLIASAFEEFHSFHSVGFSILLRQNLIVHWTICPREIQMLTQALSLTVLRQKR